MLPRVSEEAAPVGPLSQGCLPYAGNSPCWVSLQPLQPSLGLPLISAEQVRQNLPPCGCPYGWTPLLAASRKKMSKTVCLSFSFSQINPWLTLLSAQAWSVSLCSHSFSICGLNQSQVENRKKNNCLGTDCVSFSLLPKEYTGLVVTRTPGVI